MSWPPAGPADLLGLLRPDALASPLAWAAILGALLYVAGAVAVRRRRRPPGWRIGAFLAGCAVLWLFTGTAVDPLGRTYFSVFMLQQLTLMIVVPSLLVLGAPGRLLLAAVPHRGPGLLVLRAALGALRSRAARIALHPVVGIGLFLFAYYGLYLFRLADMALRVPGGDLLLEVLFVVSGLLLAVPVLGADPLPRPVGHGERALDVFVEMGLHAFFGVLVMVSTTLFVPVLAAATAAAGGDPLADQRIAGGLAWSYGEGPSVLILVSVMHRWFRSDTAAGRREEARVRAGGATPELDDYNAYLAGLAAREDRRR